MSEQVDCVQLDDEFAFTDEQFWNLLCRNRKERMYAIRFDIRLPESRDTEIDVEIVRA
jgi:hypothetical protein